MGLFSMFKGAEAQPEEITPQFALAASLIYSSAADGEMDPEEVGQLLAIMGGQAQGGGFGFSGDARAMLERAMKYVRRTPVSQFVQDAAPKLGDAQKFAILLNVLDSMLSDGQPEPEEQKVFNAMMQAWGIEEARFAPFFQVITLKYDRRLFVDPSHPMNQPGFRVTLG